MMFRNPIPLTCIRSQHRVTLLYISSIPLGTFGIMIGSTCWILLGTDFPCKFGTLVHRFPHPSRHLLFKIGIFCGMLLSTACRICFIGWLEMCCNCLRNHPSLHHGWFIVSSFPTLVVWKSVNRSP